ncbi:unnamed protein product [Absidia cylindrospora]
MTNDQRRMTNGKRQTTNEERLAQYEQSTNTRGTSKALGSPLATGRCISFFLALVGREFPYWSGGCRSSSTSSRWHLGNAKRTC